MIAHLGAVDGASRQITRFRGGFFIERETRTMKAQVRTGRDVVLLMTEAGTGTPRFVFKSRDWRQTARAQNELVDAGQYPKLEEIFSGTDAECDAFISTQRVKYALRPTKVEFAGQPKPPREHTERLGRAVVNTQTGETYPSVTEAGRRLGLPYSAVYRHCRGRSGARPVPLRFL